MSEKLRLGLIGAGSQGCYLSEAAIITGEAELCACADVNPQATESAMALCGYPRAYSDYREMLSQEVLDAVIVATTHDQLQPVALAAVEAGTPVLVEKPMALTAADGRSLADAAQQAGVVLMPGYSLRFMPERIRMKGLLDDDAVGDVVHVLAGQLMSSIDGGWLGDHARGGGPLYYIGTHVIDQVLWVVGRPAESVFAEVNWPKEANAEADALLTIRFADDIGAQVCCSQRMGGRYGWLDVVGNAGRIRAEWESNCLYVESQNMESFAHPTYIQVPVDACHADHPPEAAARLSGFKYVRAWAAELTEFFTAIREDRGPCVTAEDGVRVLEITDAVFESGRTGRSVDLK